MTDDPTRPPEATDSTERHPVYQPGPTTPINAGDAAAPAAVATVAAAGSNRTRWVVGGGVAALAIAIAIGALLLLGTSPSPEALRYIPADAAVVAEIRLDLPGDQLQKVGNLLAHFPGFQDQSTLLEKLDESLSRLVGSASEGALDYRTNIKPWLNGPTFVGFVGDAADPDNADVVVSATTNGAVDCATVFGDAPTTRESVRGVDLVLEPEAGLACVVDGRQALLGIDATVRSALEAKANGTGMDKNEHYGAARAALGGDRIATVFASGARITELMPIPSLDLDGLPGLGSGNPLGGLGGLAGAVPDWIMVGVRAEDDALVVDTVAAPVPAPTSGASLLPLPGTHPSVIAGLLPADTIAFVESQGAGVALQNALATIRADPALGQALGVLDGLGGAAGLVGWVEDAGVAVLAREGTPSAGVLLVAADEATATRQLATLNNLVALLGLSGGGIQVSQATVNGVEVTTVSITDLGSLVPPGSLPDGMTVPEITSPIEFSIAANGRTILLGVGEGFMTGVLNVQAGSSLADQAVYKTAVERGLPNSRATLYVGLATAMDLIRTMIPAEGLTVFQSDVLPYLESIDALAITTSSEGAANRSRFIITVSQP